MAELRLEGCVVDLDRGIVRTEGGPERALTVLEADLLRYGMLSAARRSVGDDPGIGVGLPVRVAPPAGTTAILGQRS